VCTNICFFFRLKDKSSYFRLDIDKKGEKSVIKFAIQYPLENYLGIHHVNYTRGNARFLSKMGSIAYIYIYISITNFSTSSMHKI